MASPSLNEITRQASLFLKDKIKTIRLALTDVTPVQLTTEEATNEDLSIPDTRTLALISRAAFEVDDYWRIVDIIHKRLSCFDRRNWRVSYKALVVLEHLLTHGPKRVAEEFQSHRDVIREMTSFQYVDERGFNWGLSVEYKSESILKMLEDVIFLKEERARTRKLTRGIKGFGSFSGRSSLVDGSLRDLTKSNSLYNTCKDQNQNVLAHNDSVSGDTKAHVHNLSRHRKTITSSKESSRIGEEFIVKRTHPFCDDEQKSGTLLLLSIE